MVVTARPVADWSGFEVDLGNRILQLALDGVAKSQHEQHSSNWCHALGNQEVLLGEVSGSGSHRAKFWKPEKSPKPSPNK